MFKTTAPFQRLVGIRFAELWAARYTTDLSALSRQYVSLDSQELTRLSGREERTRTASKIQRLLHLKCDYAGIQAHTLSSYIPNLVQFAEVKQLAPFIRSIYDKTLEIYQYSSPLNFPQGLNILQPNLNVSVADSSSSKLPSLSRATVEQLAQNLEPLLLNLQQKHLLCRDRRMIGFLTTQFHFTTKLVLAELTIAEQVLLSPYLKFAEEQVCIPWQRICAAADRHPAGSPTLELIKQMLPKSQEIATAMHRKAVRLYPKFRSRRGSLTKLDVMASSLRDLEMFQGYLWLCLLERTIASVEQELLPLCQMVFPTIDVDWSLVEQIVPFLRDELQIRLQPIHMQLVLPYLDGMQHLFAHPKPEAKLALC